MAPRKHVVLVAIGLGLCWAGLAGTVGQARAAVYLVQPGGPRRGGHQPGLGGEAVYDRAARRRRGQTG